MPTARRPQFMPKPRLWRLTARACTCNQSIWKDGKPTFAGNEYAGLSERAAGVLHRGIIKHAKALNAFNQPVEPTPNKRLVPGLRGSGPGWPIRPATASASCRISVRARRRRPSASKSAYPGSDRTTT